jgi:methanogen homoaconitase small subunit
MSNQVWKFHNDVDTDQIIASQYLLLPNIEEMKQYTFESLDPDFAKKVHAGDIVVAGENFGCGSSREQAPVAIKTAGVSAIIAKSFARIFYRNSINIGLPVIVSDIKAEDGDIISVDLSKGILINETNGETKTFEPFKEFMLSILEDGGLVNHYLNDSD